MFGVGLIFVYSLIFWRGSIFCLGLDFFGAWGLIFVFVLCVYVFWGLEVGCLYFVFCLFCSGFMFRGEVNPTHELAGSLTGSSLSLQGRGT